MEKEHEAFEATLARLEPDLPDSVQRYKQLRLKMTKFFSWRQSEDPESLADETITRAAKNIAAGEEIRAENPYPYFYGIAKNVFRENLREKEKRGELVDKMAEQTSSPSRDREDCRKQCLEKLQPEKLLLLKQYYIGDESRENLAKTLNITLNALRLQVHRIKQELRECHEECLK
jgi:DNA-directed RNA polymerase specialized sigma24 family protein